MFPFFYTIIISWALKLTKKLLSLKIFIAFNFYTKPFLNCPFKLKNLLYIDLDLVLFF